MKTYIKDLRPGGGQVKEYFALISKESRVASNQKPFVSCMLGDKTGQIKGVRWDSEDLLDDRTKAPAEVEEIVQVVATVREYNGKLDLTIEKLRRAKPAEYELGDFLPASDRPVADMMEELTRFLRTSSTVKRRELFNQVLFRFGPELSKSPAAMKYHHAFIGGLLEHTLSLVKGAVAIKKVYPMLDLDVMMAGCIFHDIGKTVELSPGLGFRYTRLGRMHGHIPIGFELAKRFFEEKLPDEPDFAEAVLHIVLSHHGEIEHGSPVVPVTREAMAFHCLDLLDSRMGAIAAAEKLPGDEEGYTAYIPMLKTAFWKGTPHPCLEEPAQPPPVGTQPPQEAPPPATSELPAMSSESPSSTTSSPPPRSPRNTAAPNSSETSSDKPEPTSNEPPQPHAPRSRPSQYPEPTETSSPSESQSNLIDQKTQQAYPD